MKKELLKKIVATTLSFSMCIMIIPASAADEISTLENCIATEIVDGEQKISEKLAEKILSLKAEEEKIPVYIWYEDTDNEKIMESVEQKTGLTVEDLNTSLEMPSEELLNEIATISLRGEDVASEECAEEMKLYLEETKAARAYEQKITDEYIITKRDVCKEMLQEKYVEVFASSALDEQDIIFKSEYSPMVIAELTKTQIDMLAKNEQIISFELYEEIEIFGEEPSWNTIANCLEINGFNEVTQKTGLTGKGVVMGMVDSDSPYKNGNEEIDFNKIKVLGEEYVKESSHSENSALIIMGKDGIAPNLSLLYCISYWKNGFYQSIEQLIKKNATVINASIAITAIRDGDSYFVCEKWLDYITNKYNLTIMQSAGNGNDKAEERKPVWIPGASYNVITVGAMNDEKTVDKSDDKAFYYSSYDTQGGCAKPDILAPANLAGGGTSSAAPVVSGIVALMLELKPSLKAQPQVIKAILMASCHRKVLDQDTCTITETMSQGITQKQGAGVVDPYIALCIVGSRQYGMVEVGTGFENIRIVQPKYKASNMNVTIAWFQQNIAVSGTIFENPNVGNGNNHNLSLAVKRNLPNYSKSSNLSNSSAEMVYVPLSEADSNYLFQIKGDAMQEETVQCAYAWSIDKSQFQKPSITGIYRLKNKANGFYLDVDSSGRIKQWVYANDTSQEWVILNKGKESGSNMYTLTNDTYAGYAGEGGIANADDVYADLKTDVSTISIYETKSDIIITKNKTSDPNHLMSMQPKDESTSAGQRICWSEVSDWNSDYHKWVLEKVNYCYGDVDKNGILESEDSNIILEYAVNLATLTESQKYLADVNQDGEITSADALEVLKMIVNLE